MDNAVQLELFVYFSYACKFNQTFVKCSHFILTTSCKEKLNTKNKNLNKASKHKSINEDEYEPSFNEERCCMKMV